jgi:hypothetical protein
MKKIILSAILFVFSLFFFSCSDSTSPNEGTINVDAQMLNPKVSMVVAKSKSNNEIQANEVDSIKLSSVRILLSEMKLHPQKTDSTDGKTIKTAPFLFQVDNSGNFVQLTTASIPVGNYEKIKFEFHRFSSSDVSKYASDVVLKDFTTSERYSIIITGKYYKNNLPTDFTYNSKITANLSLNFDTPIEIKEGATSAVVLQIDPLVIFKKSGSILNPTDSKNYSDIENAIKSTIKALKK